MKDYKDYFNQIEAPSSLKEKVWRKKKRNSYMIPAIVLAIALSFITIKINMDQFEPLVEPPIEQPSEQPKITASLTFNEVQHVQQDAKLYIPGYFWEELTKEQLDKLVQLPPTMPILHSIANYSSEENIATLFDIMINGETENKHLFHVQLAKDFIRKDYFISVEPDIQEYKDISISAGFYPIHFNNEIILFSSFMIDDVAYEVTLNGLLTDKELLAREMNQLITEIINGGKAPLNILNPTVPLLLDKQLTLEEALSDEEFGYVVPKYIPNNFYLLYAHRIANSDTNALSLSYYTENSDYIDWQIYKGSTLLEEYVVKPQEKEKYDFRLYTLPLADSVPEEFSYVIHHPIFYLEDITLELLYARNLSSIEENDLSNTISLSLIKDDLFITISTKGLSPEEVYELIGWLK